MNHEAYLDHNAFSPLRPSVREAMEPWLGERGANPSSPHRRGMRARAALDEARERIAAALGADDHDVVFTSGATESNHLALLGVGRALLGERSALRLVTTAVEHPSVLAPAQTLLDEGASLRQVPPDPSGRIDLDEVLAALDEAIPLLLSTQAVQHETGAVLPIDRIGRDRPASAVFHVDAAQAVGKVPLDLAAARIDLLSCSGHKLGGPPGVGALLVRRGTPVRPLMTGGRQEGGLRSGTVPVALAIGLAAAIEEAVGEREEVERRHARLARRVLEALARIDPDHVVFGAEPRHPGTLMVAFPEVDREALLVNLDLRGVRISTGAACASGSLETSPVLRAMGVPERLARCAVRISFGWCTSERDIDLLLDALPESLERARNTKIFFRSQHDPN